MASIINAEPWPEILERERSIRWTPDFGMEAGPPALDGTRQYRSINGGGVWRCAFNTVQLRSRPQVLAWMATEALLLGGTTPVDIPLLLCQYQPRNADGSPIVITADSGGWEAGSMQGVVALEDAGELIAGQHFSDFDPVIYGWRLYRIMKVNAASGGGANKRDIVFWPPARFEVEDEHELEFNEPRCVMRLAENSAMDLELELRKRGDPSVEFIEAF